MIPYIRQTGGDERMFGHLVSFLERKKQETPRPLFESSRTTNRCRASSPP